MEIHRERGDTRPGPREWFTGQVWMDEIADDDGQTIYWGEHVTEEEYRA
jgi:hypothetical protein